MKSEGIKRIILIGRSGCGKTTLCQYLNNEAIKYLKTQTVQVINNTMIDTPGEYAERTAYRGALLVSSADADVVILVQDATDDTSYFPPAYSSQFSKLVVGVVSKKDIATEEQIERAKVFLITAGAKKLYVTSSYDGTGFEELKKDLGY